MPDNNLHTSRLFLSNMTKVPYVCMMSMWSWSVARPLVMLEKKKEEPEVLKYRKRVKSREDQNHDYEPTELGFFSCCGTTRDRQYVTAVSGAGFYASATPQLDDRLKHVAQQVQDPDNSSQTMYDSWIASGRTPTVSILRAVQISFSSTVFLAILCTYAGQAAYLTKFPDDVTDTFYKSIPGMYNATLVHYTLYKPSELCACVKALHRLFCNSYNTSLPAIREKYSQHKVAIRKQYSSKTFTNVFSIIDEQINDSNKSLSIWSVQTCYRKVVRYGQSITCYCSSWKNNFTAQNR
ncbi:hypothetical protein Sjap_005275 [Stephania japonica]|uniref:Cyclin C-terminal domain-containing protein n=1 Tax=Stephania japonica TaxID=461633 RepID=A0AAP0PIL4_9MAGN